MGDQRSEAIANMEAMGFERSQIDAAMRAAFFNPDRAVEYLLNVSAETQSRPGRAKSLTRNRVFPTTSSNSSVKLLPLPPSLPVVLLPQAQHLPPPVVRTMAA